MRLVSGKLLILAAVCLLATVVHSCKEGELIKVMENCNEYDECIDGTLVRKGCKLGEYFDGKKCDNFLNVNCIKKPCTEGRIYERGTCGIDYDICQDGKLRREVCPAMFRFNGKSCVPLELCKDATINTELLHSTVSVTNKCTEGDKIPQDEYAYMECISGVFVMKPCKPGFAFNKFTKSCQTVSLDLKDVVCTESNRRPLPDCSTYQSCESGTYVNRTCPAKMLFDKNTLMCRFEWDATCFNGSCKDGVLLPDLNDCAGYYTCNKGKKERQRCFMRSFDPVEQACTWTKHCERDTCKGEWTKVSQDCKQYTICANGYKITYSCPVLQKYIDGECKLIGTCTQPNGLIVKDESKKEKCVNGVIKRAFGRCTEYMKCADNQWKMMRCPKGTNFQEDACEKKQCPLIPILNSCKEFKEPGNDKIYECETGYLFDVNERQCVHASKARCAKGECIIGEKTNHPSDCSKYKVCKDGKWEIESCSFFFSHFDITLKECRFWRYNCSYDADQCTTGKLRPDRSNCKAYEKCEANSWRTNNCWFWQHFDSRTNLCATFSYKCAEIPKQVDVKTTQPKSLEPNNEVDKNQVLNSKCTEGEIKPIPNTCRWYTKCVNGSEIPQKCTPCKNYNAELNGCEWVWKKPCKPGVTDPPYISPQTPSTPSTKPTTTTTTPKPPTTKPECNTENDKRGVKKDCNKYQVCKSGKWIDEKCSAWGKFDTQTKECFYFQMWKVKCA
uniref:Putative chitin binding peritrophin-a domain protein n=1 Tax=Panstrongylus lignarius TaxID=156445 RepID=A0A224XC79_9HEMI